MGGRGKEWSGRPEKSKKVKEKAKEWAEEEKSGLAARKRVKK